MIGHIFVNHKVKCNMYLCFVLISFYICLIIWITGVEKMCVLVYQITSSCDLIIIVWYLNSIPVQLQMYVFMLNVWNSINKKNRKPKTKHKKQLANKKPPSSFNDIKVMLSAHISIVICTHFFLFKIKALHFLNFDDFQFSLKVNLSKRKVVTN